jgi:hypothetical protein
MHTIKSQSYINYIILSLVISIGLIISACTPASDQGSTSSQLESSETPQITCGLMLVVSCGSLPRLAFLFSMIMNGTCAPANPLIGFWELILKDAYG